MSFCHVNTLHQTVVFDYQRLVFHLCSRKHKKRLFITTQSRAHNTMVINKQRLLISTQQLLLMLLFEKLFQQKLFQQLVCVFNHAVSKREFFEGTQNTGLNKTG